MNLIGIHGHAGVGKDTAANFICNTYKNHYIESFAGPLKEAASIAFGIPLENFHDKDLKEETDENWGVSPRAIAQFMGTEMFRDTIHKLMPELKYSFWIARMNQRLKGRFIPEGLAEYDDDDTIVIPDVRFQDEYDWILSEGGIIIHITRDGHNGNVGISNHPSESSINLHNSERTYICVNNYSLNELYKTISNILTVSKY